MLIIEGGAFADRAGFYAYMAGLLTRGLDWTPGQNLDALADLLRGGFGVYGYGEPAELLWRDFDKSRAALGDGFLLTVLEIMLRAENCRLRIE